jgi:Na+/H+-translocating membrane pyrophosphatase
MVKLPTGHGTNIIAGLAVIFNHCGPGSDHLPCHRRHYFAGLFGIAIAAVPCCL